MLEETYTRGLLLRILSISISTVCAPTTVRRAFLRNRISLSQIPPKGGGLKRNVIFFFWRDGVEALGYNLLRPTEALLIAKTDSKSSVIILLDLSATFETVHHQILLSALSSQDITGIPLCWFESYLTGFRVAWGGEVSNAHQFYRLLGFPRDQFLDASSSPDHWVPSYRRMAFPTISTLMTHSSISLFNQMIQR